MHIVGCVCVCVADWLDAGVTVLVFVDMFR